MCHLIVIPYKFTCGGVKTPCYLKIHQVWQTTFQQMLDKTLTSGHWPGFPRTPTPGPSSRKVLLPHLSLMQQFHTWGMSGWKWSGFDGDLKLVHFTCLWEVCPTYWYYRGYNPFTKYHEHPVCQICYEMFAQMSISLSPKISKMSSEKHLKKKVSFGIKTSLFLGWMVRSFSGDHWWNSTSRGFPLVNSTKPLASTSWFPQPNPPPALSRINKGRSRLRLSRKRPAVWRALDL